PPATTEIYTLSLHDALPIYGADRLPRVHVLAHADADAREVRVHRAHAVAVGDRHDDSPAPAKLARPGDLSRRCCGDRRPHRARVDRKSTRLNSSHSQISYAV